MRFLHSSYTRATLGRLTGGAAAVVTVVIEPEHCGGTAAGRCRSGRRHACRRGGRRHGADRRVHVVRQEGRSHGRLCVEVRHSACGQIVGSCGHGHVVVMQAGSRVRSGRRREA